MIPIGVLEAILRLRDEMSPKLQVAGEQLQQTGRSMTRVGAGLTAGLTLPIAGVGIAAIKAATDFNKGMANVATLIPGNTERVKELKRSVQDMAVATGKSTTDISEGLYQVVSAFGDTADTAKILQTNVEAAAAGLATTSEAIALTSAVTKAYGDTSAEAVQAAADMAFVTVKLGQTSFPELAASIGKVAIGAAGLKISQQELNAVFATMTGVTGGAAEVATQFRGAMTGLKKPSDDMIVALDEIGFSTEVYGARAGEAAVESLGFQGTLAALTEASGGNAAAMAKLFGSTESWDFIAGLAGSQAETFGSKLGELAEFSGAATEALNEQQRGVNEAGFHWEVLKQKVVVAAQKFGDELLPIVMRVGESLRPLLDMVLRGAEWFGKLPVPVQTAGVMLAGLAAAAGPVLIVLGTMASSIGTLLPLLTGAGLAGAASSVIAVLTGPVGWVLAIGAVVSALGFLVLKVQESNRILEEHKRRAEEISEAARDYEREAQLLAGTFRGALSQGLDAARQATDEYLDSLELGAEGVVELSSGLRLLLNDNKLTREQFNELSGALAEYRQRSKDAALQLPILSAEQDRAREAARLLAEALEGFTLAEDVAKDIDKLRLAVESAEAPTVQLEAAWKDLVAKMQEAGLEIPVSMSAIADSLNIVERSFERAREEQEKRWDTANLKALNDGFDQLQTELLEAEKAALQAGEALKNFVIQPPDPSTIPQIDAVTLAAERLGLKAVNVEELNKSFADLQAVVAAGGFAPSDLKRIYDDLYRTFQQLGPLTDEQAAAFERLRGQIEQQPNLSFFGKIGDSLKSVFGKLAELGSVFTNALGTLFTDGLSGALGALQTGLSQLLSKAFNSVIPGLGTLAAPLISAIENLLSGMFGKAHAADHVAEQFGIALSDGLAKAIDDLAASQFQGNFDAAFRSMMAQAIQEASITTEAELSKWVTLTHQILSSVDEGFMSLQQAVESMSDSWLALVPAMEATGASAMGLQAQISDLISRGVDLDTLATQLQPVISAMFDSGISGAQELVDWLNTMGVEIDGVATSAEAAVAAIEAAFGAGDFSAMSTAIRDAIAAGVDLSSLQGLLTDVMAQYKDLVLGASQEVVAGVEALFATVRREVEVLAEDGSTQTIEQLRLTKREAEFAASALLVTFEQMRAAGVPLTEIFEAMGDQITQLADNFKGALPPVLAEVDALFSAMQGSAAKAIEKVDAIGGSIGALGEMGLLSAGQLDFFGDKIDRAYAKLIEGGAGSEQAMALLGPQLRQLIDLSEQYGFKIDRNTRALIDQADASGLLPPAIEPVEDIFGDIRSVIILLAESLGVQVPAAIKQAADAAQEAENRIKSPFKRAFMEMAADAGWAARETRGVWRQLSPDLRRVFEEGGEVGRAQFKQIAMAAGLSAAQVRQLWGSDMRTVEDIFGHAGTTGEEENVKVGEAAEREAKRSAREMRIAFIDRVIPALRRIGQVGEIEAKRLGDAFVGAAKDSAAEWEATQRATVGNSSILDISRRGIEAAEVLGGSQVEAAMRAAHTWSLASDTIARSMNRTESAVSAIPSSVSVSVGTGPRDSIPAPVAAASAPAPSRRPDETLLRELLHELRALRQDQRTYLPDALRTAARHGKQTSS